MLLLLLLLCVWTDLHTLTGVPVVLSGFVALPAGADKASTCQLSAVMFTEILTTRAPTTAV